MQKTMIVRLCLSWLVTLGLVMSGCTTAQVSYPPSVRTGNSSLKDGQRATLIMTNGEVMKGRVLNLNDDHIQFRNKGSDINRVVPWSSVRKIEHRKFSYGKTIGLAALVLLAVARASGGPPCGLYCAPMFP
ncbi:MAG: hypothetical protein AAF438_03275 [Pseudomonadota bacterium]